MSLADLFGGGHEEEDTAASVPSAARPLSDPGGAADYNAKLGGGTQSGFSNQPGYSDYLDKFKASLRPPQQQSSAPGAMPNFRGGFQRGWGTAQQAFGPSPQFGSLNPQQPQAPFGAALARFQAGGR